MMGAAFAIQVKTGRETAIKKLVEWAFAQNEVAQKWVKAVHAFTKGTQRMLDDDGRLGKRIEKPVIPGYIFIEMNYSVDDENRTAYLPHQLWHLVKSVPGVLKLFANAGQIIGAETFRELFERLESCEEQVEIAVSDTSAIEEKEMAVACAAYNEATTRIKKRSIEETLKRIEKMRNAYQNALKKLTAIYRHGKHVIHAPKKAFVAVLSRLSEPIPRTEFVKRLAVILE